MKPALVIGYGNPLREDDGIGWRAAELVEHTARAGSVEVLQCHQLTPELATQMEGRPLVIFLDAAGDITPRTIDSRELNEAGDGAWSHHLSPEQVLTLARRAGYRVPKAVLITGGIVRMGYGETLSAAGEHSAKQMAQHAIDLIALSSSILAASVSCREKTSGGTAENPLSAWPPDTAPQPA
jgi:hydrogenase maturation protease